LSFAGEGSASAFAEAIGAEMLSSALDGERERMVIGTYTLVSGGYEVQADIEMTRWSDQWEDSQRLWWLLTLRNVRWLGRQNFQPCTHSM